MSEIIKADKLIGIWLGESEVGKLKAEFTEAGALIYTVCYGEKKFSMEFSYQIEDNFLLLKQPSTSAIEKTEFMLNGNKLILKRNAEAWLFTRAVT